MSTFFMQIACCTIKHMNEILTFIALTCDLVGTLLIAYAALSVHHRFRHEHKVDESIFKAMRREQRLALIGASLLVIGYGAFVYLEFFV